MKHGSDHSYTKLKCRCPECTDAHRVERNRYMEAHPEQREKARLRELARNKARREAQDDGR